MSLALATDPDGCNLEPMDRAMIDYALKLTRTPGEMVESDVTTLKGAGFDDTGVLDICQVASYYAYVNRLADGLGVELEDYWVEEPGQDESMVITRAEFEGRGR